MNRLQTSRSPVPIVGIGASAGGLEALRDMLSSARAPTGMAFVIVQHLDPNHESMLAELLDRHTSLTVLQSDGGEKIEADNVYIIPPGHGLVIRDGRLELTDFAQPRGLRRPIDDFFISLASDQQANAACVILSGTGADGTTGLRAVKEYGGVCIVQQPESAKYDGMPLSAVGTGLVDFVKPAGQILDCLSGYFHRRATSPIKEQAAEIVADHVDDLCLSLRKVVGHDFSGYKRTTVVRRVERRMQVLGIQSGRSYLDRVRSDPAECEALFRDLLINVTRFFRDREMFEVLREKVIAPLVRDRPSGDDLRIWIPGCSSGEEAYSIAMLFADEAQAQRAPNAIQIFATDIDESMLGIAREGTYSNAAMVDIPLHMRERFVIPHADRFTIATPIRDLIRFSSHSIVKDPPFSRIDLVSCRNLLIYFDEQLQQSVMPLLHYAIRPDGFLFLGPSESVGRFDHLFPAIDSHARIFQRSPGPPNYPIDLPGSHRQHESRVRSDPDRSEKRQHADESSAARRVLDRYAPPSMLLDQDGAIIAAYGRLSQYFEFPVTRTGGSSAISLARPGLRNVIGPLLRSARDKKKRAIVRKVEVRTDHGIQEVDAICDPMRDGTFLFVFRDASPFQPMAGDDLAELEVSEDHLDSLEDELRITRHRLRSTVEELETANEELKSSNEEMMSMNEELQSTNEELTTVNDELKSKVDQLTVANADLNNFFESTELAVVVLDKALKVRNFTEAVTSIFPLQPSDRGRPLEDVAGRLASTVYLEDARAVVGGHETIQRRVSNRGGDRTFSLRTIPYRTQQGEIVGATLVLTDITDALSLERDLARQRERLDMAIKAGGIGVWEFCLETGATSFESRGDVSLGRTQVDGVPVDVRMDRIISEDRTNVEIALRQAATGQNDFEVSCSVRRDDGELRRIKSYGKVINGDGNRRLVGVSIDVTAEYRLAETRELMLREMNHRVKNLFAIIGGMISAAARSHTELPVFAADMRERIAALGRAHSLVSLSTEGQPVALRELVEATVEPYRDQAEITVSGPGIVIARSCLSPFALMLHEWATNSAKYGAIAARNGKLSIDWDYAGDGFDLRWTEVKDEPVVMKSKKGFGSLLVESSSRQLGTQVEQTINGGTFRLSIHLSGSVMAHD
ncbi:MAG: PAS domain-containing protein [Novosphingobium sp.]|nr:PAS domain-containing protein [Novosphingobium sp.]